MSAYCPTCRRRFIVKVGDVWQARLYDAQIVVTAIDADGVSVKQGDRPQDGHWRISTADLVAMYARTGKAGAVACN